MNDWCDTSHLRVYRKITDLSKKSRKRYHLDQDGCECIVSVRADHFPRKWDNMSRIFQSFLDPESHSRRGIKLFFFSPPARVSRRRTHNMDRDVSSPAVCCKLLMQPRSLLPHGGGARAYKPISLMNMESLRRAITHDSKQEKRKKCRNAECLI